MPVEQFDGRSLSDKPPRLGSRAGTTSVPDGGPGSAHGTPPALRKTDGTENLGTAAKTLQAGDSRPQSSSGKGPTPPQHFNDSAV